MHCRSPQFRGLQDGFRETQDVAILVLEQIVMRNEHLDQAIRFPNLPRYFDVQTDPFCRFHPAVDVPGLCRCGSLSQIINQVQDFLEQTSWDDNRGQAKGIIIKSPIGEQPSIRGNPGTVRFQLQAAGEINPRRELSGSARRVTRAALVLMCVLH